MQKERMLSLVIPTYNRASLIGATLTSLLAQTYPSFEILVIDDGSTDNTGEVMQAITDKRVKYFKKENGERGAARNFGVQKSTGDYICFFDSDDVAYPHHLQTAVETIERLNSPEIFHLGYDVKTPDGKTLSRYDSFDGNVEKYAIDVKNVSINSLFVRKDIAKEIPFSENRLLSASEDALYLCQLCARYKLHYNNTITTTILEHDSRSMVLASETQLINRRRLLVEGLEADKVFMNKYGPRLKNVYAAITYLLVLCCLQRGENKKARRYFIDYLSKNLQNIFTINTLYFTKKYIQNIFSH